MFDHHPKEGETPPFKGSMLVVVAESEQEVRETLAKDIYATSGVWDIDNVRTAHSFFLEVSFYSVNQGATILT